MSIHIKDKGKWHEISNTEQVIIQEEYIEPTLYQGVDLTVKFADEIKNFNGDAWAWIKDRIINANWYGLHVCDYIPYALTTDSEQYSLHAQIAGIDTYYQSNYINIIGHHIDFMSKELYPHSIVWNNTLTNNGTSAQHSPWLASELYSTLNSLVFKYLPSNLQSQIIEKQWYIESRYSSSGVLKSSNSWEWGTLNKLWLPTEYEIFGSTIAGTPIYSVGMSIQYPIFANRSRIRFINNTERRSY